MLEEEVYGSDSLIWDPDFQPGSTTSASRGNDSYSNSVICMCLIQWQISLVAMFHLCFVFILERKKPVCIIKHD